MKVLFNQEKLSINFITGRGCNIPTYHVIDFAIAYYDR
jgi:hypothetical protein